MTYWRLFYHLVWATKNRERLIQPTFEDRLYAYIVHKAEELEVFVYAINGWYDHVHLVVAIPPKHAVSQVVKHLKGSSSHELNLPGGADYPFAWQRGYGVLSLGERQLPHAETYVREQKIHHARGTMNAWLEHCGEEGEDARANSTATVREEPAAYWSSDELPF